MPMQEEEEEEEVCASTAILLTSAVRPVTSYDAMHSGAPLLGLVHPHVPVDQDSGPVL